MNAENKFRRAHIFLQFFCRDYLAGVNCVTKKGFHNLAMTLHIVKQPEPALHAINQALALAPANKNSLLPKSAILRELGMDEEAQAITDQAEFLPDDNWSERFPLR